MSEAPEIRVLGPLTYDEVKDLARWTAARESTYKNINAAKADLSSARAERRVLRTMFMLLSESHLEISNENALHLVCDDAEAFISLEREQKYKEAGKMLDALRGHTSKKMTPLSLMPLIRLDEYPERLQRKAMIMAIHDLSDN